MEENNLPNFALVDPDGVVKLEPNPGEEKGQLGECVICKVTTSRRCQVCAASTSSSVEKPFYCGKEHQKEDWARHKLTCLWHGSKKSEKTPLKVKRPVDSLRECIANDCLPAIGSPCHSTFGFSKCSTESDEASLLGLYVGLIRVLQVDLDLLDEAARKRELAQFICSQYETSRPDPATRSAYYEWFVKNQHVVQ